MHDLKLAFIVLYSTACIIQTVFSWRRFTWSQRLAMAIGQMCLIFALTDWVYEPVENISILIGAVGAIILGVMGAIRRGSQTPDPEGSG